MGFLPPDDADLGLPPTPFAGAMKPEVAENIRQSALRQRALNRGVLDPTQVNEAASLADDALVERRQNTADRQAQREMLARLPGHNLQSGMREVVLELLDRVGVLEARVSDIVAGAVPVESVVEGTGFVESPIE